MHGWGFYRKYPTRKISGVCTSIGYGNRSNHFHYNIDCLTRLFSLHHPICQRFQNIKLLDTRARTTEETVVLKALLPKNVNLEMAAEKERIRADRYLFLPFLTARGNGYLPQTVREFFIPRVIQALDAEPDNCFPKKIFISRQKVKRRNFVNEVEFSKNLAKQGYETVILEDFSFREQIALFLGLTHVVACHGAGLTNLIFSPPGVKVLEIFPSAVEKATYEMLSLCKGHDYRCTRLNSSGLHADSEVPIRKMMRLVRHMENA